MEVLPLIESKLSQRPLESKKAIYAMAASACVLFVFAGSAFLILHHAEAAKDIVELGSLTIMFFGAIATTLITGTAVMDWKAVSAIQRLTEDRKVDTNEQAPEVQVNERSYKPKYYRD